MSKPNDQKIVLKKEEFYIKSIDRIANTLNKCREDARKKSGGNPKAICLLDELLEKFHDNYTEIAQNALARFINVIRRDAITDRINKSEKNQKVINSLHESFRQRRSDYRMTCEYVTACQEVGRVLESSNDSKDEKVSKEYITNLIHLGNLLCYIIIMEFYDEENSKFCVLKLTRKSRIIQVRADFLKRLSKTHFKTPMLSKPAEWKRDRGIFLGPFGNSYEELKVIGNPRHKELVENLFSDDPIPIPMVSEALDYLGSTAWEINTEVLTVFKKLVNESYKKEGIKKLGISRDQANKLKVPYLEDVVGDLDYQEINNDNLEEIYSWWKLKDQVSKDKRLQNNRMIKIININDKAIELAPGDSRELAFHFPYYCDFRGRVYAIADSLSPQGQDVERALLRFHHGKEIKGNGVTWLMRQGANCFGLGKQTFAAREKWVREHQDAILEVGTDPLENKWWMEADKPWQFLAFCFEWKDFVNSNCEFKSKIVCSVDGSCNGIQHYSVLAGDKSAAKYTNVIMGDPQDIYEIILNDLDQQILRDPDAIKNVISTWKMSWSRNAKTFAASLEKEKSNNAKKLPNTLKKKKGNNAKKLPNTLKKKIKKKRSLLYEIKGGLSYERSLPTYNPDETFSFDEIKEMLDKCVENANVLPAFNRKMIKTVVMKRQYNATDQSLKNDLVSLAHNNELHSNRVPAEVQNVFELILGVYFAKAQGSKAFIQAISKITSHLLKDLNNYANGNVMNIRDVRKNSNEKILRSKKLALSFRLNTFQNKVKDVKKKQEIKRLICEEIVSNKISNTMDLSLTTINQSLAKNIPNVLKCLDDLNEISSFLQKETASDFRDLEWETPSGWMVRHSYRIIKKYGITVRYPSAYGKERKRFQITASQKTQTIDIKRSKRAFLANYVHSFDASHLILAVNKFFGSNIIDSASVIHDSFGALAADMDALSESIKASFYTMYNNNSPIIELLDKNQECFTDNPKYDELKDRAIKNDVCKSKFLEQVLGSDYFFS